MPTTYQAGYYLLRLWKSLDGLEPIFSCTSCYNDLAFGTWCLSWVDQFFSKEEKERLKIDETVIRDIEQWTDTKFDYGEIYLGNSLPTARLAREFKNLFFKGREDIHLLHIAFPKQEAERFLTEFAAGNNSHTFNLNNGEFDLYRKLIQKESVDKKTMTFMGYDLIAVECDGSLHSFHCYNLHDELYKYYNLKVNEHGFFDQILDIDGLAAYLNDPNNEIASIPFYVVEMYQLHE